MRSGASGLGGAEIAAISVGWDKPEDVWTLDSYLSTINHAFRGCAIACQGRLRPRPPSWTDRAEFLFRSSLECTLAKHRRRSATLGGCLRDERRARDIDRFGDHSDVEKEICQRLLLIDDFGSDGFNAEGAARFRFEQDFHVEPCFAGQEFGDFLCVLALPGLGLRKCILQGLERLGVGRGKCARREVVGAVEPADAAVRDDGARAGRNLFGRVVRVPDRPGIDAAPLERGFGVGRKEEDGFGLDQRQPAGFEGAHDRKDPDAVPQSGGSETQTTNRKEKDLWYLGDKSQ